MYLQNEKSTEYVEGEIYEIVEIGGHRFEIVCGYNGKQEIGIGIIITWINVTRIHRGTVIRNSQHIIGHQTNHVHVCILILRNFKQSPTRKG